MGMHKRNMARVPKIFHKTQNNTHCLMANNAALKAAIATNTSMVDMYNVTANKVSDRLPWAVMDAVVVRSISTCCGQELWSDTLDGTHIGWRGNAVKVDRILRAIPNAGFR